MEVYTTFDPNIYEYSTIKPPDLTELAPPSSFTIYLSAMQKNSSLIVKRDRQSL